MTHLIHVTRLVGMCDMTRWYVWHDSLICMTWRTDVFDMTNLWLIEICDMTHGYVWHHSHRHTRFCTRAFWRERPYQSQRTALQKLLLMSLARRVSAKEPYVYTKRAVYMQKSLTYTPEVALEGLCKRALNINQKSFIYTPKELYIYPKRALYIHPKSPIYTPKEL